jgi:DNA-binding IscR family transcriptional regulator
VSFGVKKSILDAVLGILKDAGLVSSDAEAEALVVEGGLIP